jgi:hypothetical protein
MQHAELNRATIRVADRTDVCGRVTADEVNLDRFHNHIRKVCALVAAALIFFFRWMLLFTVLIVPQALWAAPSAPATPQPNPTNVVRYRGGSEQRQRTSGAGVSS